MLKQRIERLAEVAEHGATASIRHKALAKLAQLAEHHLDSSVRKAALARMDNAHARIVARPGMAGEIELKHVSEYAFAPEQRAAAREELEQRASAKS